MDKYKEILLRTLDEFDDFCVKNDLTYFAAYGTCIGAIRDKGLIPWDDDIDVWMLRKDYDKLLSLRNKVRDGYEIMSLETEGYYLPYAKFCDSNTTIWEMKIRPFIMGVFIDIFPLDEIDSSSSNAIGIVRACKHATTKMKGAMTYHSFRRELEQLIGLHLGELKRNLKDIFFFRHSKAGEYKRDVIGWDNTLKSLRGDSLMVYNCVYPMQKEIFKKEWFTSYKTVPYENTHIRVPVGYDSLLTQIYGDYMTPPPTSKRVTHHGHYFVDLDKRLSIDEVKTIMSNR